MVGVGGEEVERNNDNGVEQASANSETAGNSVYLNYRTMMTPSTQAR